ncbi:hypothetical protein TorRG33x02_305950, partial [Trema orientale]
MNVESLDSSMRNLEAQCKSFFAIQFRVSEQNFTPEVQNVLKYMNFRELFMDYYELIQREYRNWVSSSSSSSSSSFFFFFSNLRCLTCNILTFNEKCDHG